MTDKEMREMDLKDLNHALEGVKTLRAMTNSDDARRMRGSVKLSVDIASTGFSLTEEEERLLDEANNYLAMEFFIQFPRN